MGNKEISCRNDGIIGTVITNLPEPIGTWKRDLKAGETVEIELTMSDDGLPVLKSDAIEFN